jgi:hypothetical protein
MHVDKMTLKKLSKVSLDEDRDRYRQYVELIFKGETKIDAMKEVFPDRYLKVKDKGNMAIGREVGLLERNNIVQDMYAVVHKTWWKDFIVKKQDMFSNLYDLAMDKENSPRDRINASKTLLQHIPEAPTEININSVVEHKISFEDKLKNMQRQLYKAANNIEEVEVIEHEELKVI